MQNINTYKRIHESVLDDIGRTVSDSAVGL